MGFSSLNALISNLPSYQGRFLATSTKKTPLSTLLGLQQMDRAQSPFENVNAMKYAMSQSYSLDAGSQPAITENDTFNAPTSEINATTQNTNVCQVFRQGLKMSDLKMSDQSISGVVVNGMQVPLNEFMKQVEIAMQQLKIDLEYSILNGAYQDGVDGDTAFKMRGLITAITTNVENASASALTKDMFEGVIGSALVGGADFNRPVVMGNQFNIRKLMGLYAVVERSNNRGGYNLSTIDVPNLGLVDIVFNPQMVASTLVVTDLDHLKIVSNTTPGYDQISVREPSNVGQGMIADLYAKLGIDYGHESKHAKITNLTTS